MRVYSDHQAEFVRSKSLPLYSSSSSSSLPAGSIFCGLVDADGFPRADVDLYAVRHARVRIIELRNDLRAVMDRLANALAGAFPPPGAADDTAESGQGAESPFAKVDGVTPGSPASSAGLQRDDLFVKFGTLTASAFAGASLALLVELVGTHENRSIPFKVRRGERDVFLSLTPRNG